MSKRCLGCMELFGDEFEICPHCGYIVGTPAEEAIHIEPGTLLHDRYIIGKVLGYGGFGVTYLGWDGKLEQKVAIKEYLPGEFSTRMPGQSQVSVFNGEKSEQFRDGLRKFVEEAKRLAKFQNEPGIVKIFDSFEENDTAYIVMEYLEGETLTAYLKREKTIPENEAVEMLMPVMESLQVVHAEGLLHRDIAPDNIFLTASGEVKLIDFGASRYATTSHSRSLTVIIKPGYSPEEQYRNKSDQGAHTDVYALSATLYKMITGKTPPDAMERRAKYENQNKDILEEPHKINKNISLNRENAILNAMNVRIEDRTPDVATFIRDLNADPPVKRIYGKIKKIDLYHWPLWLKVTVPAVLSLLLLFGILLWTDVIDFSRFSEEIVIPDGIVTVPDVEGLYNDEALDILTDNKLLVKTGGTVESDYIPAGKIVLQTPVGGSYLGQNGTIVLMVSSGGGVEEAVDGISTVPYIIWDSKEDAIAKLEKANLGAPIIEEAYDDSVTEGHVISQSIRAGEKVEEWTVITIQVSKGAPPFDMIDVVGKDRVKAEKELNDKGLMVVVEYRNDNSVPENCVISQSVKKGEQVKRGDTVTLVISSGQKLINVADVTGRTRDDAVSRLEEQGFAVVVSSVYDANVESGKVISQTPEAGSSQVEGTVITIHVSMGKRPVTVTLDPNGGTVSKNSVTVYHTGTYETLPTPTREGYSFDGWYTAKSGGTKVTSSTQVSAQTAHTLFALWSPLKEAVQFDANGGSVPVTDMSVTYGSAYGSLPAAVRIGYTFEGWYTAKSGGTRVTQDTTVTTTNTHTLYARWKANEYTVTFNANGGSVSTTGKTVAYDAVYGTLPTPTRTGYSFDGWYTASVGGSKITSSSIMKSTSAQTLYAHWKANTYTVIFNANGGSGSMSAQTLTFGQSKALTSNAFTKSGCGFLGWSTSAGAKTAQYTNGQSVVDLTQTSGGSVTLYAVWESLTLDKTQLSLYRRPSALSMAQQSVTLATVNTGTYSNTATLSVSITAWSKPTGTLTATSSAGTATVTWSTSNSSVATVRNGTVTGIAEGSATITATAASGAKATCTVTVESDGSIAWATSDSSVATVNSLLHSTIAPVTAVSKGTVTVTAYVGVPPSYSCSATCTVTVLEAYKAIPLTSTSMYATFSHVDYSGTRGLFFYNSGNASLFSFTFVTGTTKPSSGCLYQCYSSNKIGCRVYFSGGKVVAAQAYNGSWSNVTSTYTLAANTKYTVEVSIPKGGTTCTIKIKNDTGTTLSSTSGTFKSYGTDGSSNASIGPKSSIVDGNSPNINLISVSFAGTQGCEGWTTVCKYSFDCSSLAIGKTTITSGSFKAAFTGTKVQYCYR